MKINLNMSAKDIFNARNASVSVKSLIGEEVTATGCAVLENEGKDKQNKPCDVGYIATDKGVVGFTSNVMLGAMEMFAEILQAAEEPVKIRFFSGTSKNGSEYYNFEII